MSKRHIIATNVTIMIMLVTLATFSFAFNEPTAEAVGKNGAIYLGNASNNNVSLMINVYWGEEYLPQMLDEMKKSNIKCTFFIGGMWIEKNLEILKRIKDEGHEIGNHGYMHKDAEHLNYARNFSEIDSTNKLLAEKLGIEVKLFAPPSGSIGSEMFKCADALKMKVIMWSKDTIDWRDKNTETITNRATKNIKNGDLILMHPTKNTAEALPNIIKSIIGQGFTLTSVSKNLE